jgi:hypothetical protein
MPGKDEWRARYVRHWYEKVNKSICIRSGLEYADTL